MPFISTKTNVKISEEKETQLKERLGQAIAIIPGKVKAGLCLLSKVKSLCISEAIIQSLLLL